MEGNAGMAPLDYVVLTAYFLGMAGIGWICLRRTQKQEDFFLGGRSFGKLLQTFAAFGAGTSANEPIQVGRTVWTSGLSGIWSVFLWLFVTPFYWIFGVWYRRMRLLTLGDWFVERYNSPGLGAAYALFAIAFYMNYLSTNFSAISKAAAPLMNIDTIHLPGMDGPVGLEMVLVPIIAAVVVIYGVLGGLRAAYWTDLVQGLCIIFLSLILVPFGLKGLVEEHGTPEQTKIMDGFEIMHDRVSDEYFQLFEGPRAGEFPLHYIVSLSLLGLVGIVVQPHFIATGGGSARTENSARIGLVTGNFLKRFCSVGWAIAGLIMLALMAGNSEIGQDPDRLWGVASREILGPLNLGLVGLMLACLLAALMSSADCYMLVTSALVVRNIYVRFINPDASEATCVRLGRIVGLVMITGAAFISLRHMDVFSQFKFTLELPILFAAPFWWGMVWRRPGKWAAWIAVLYSLLVFFVIPMVLPMVYPDLRHDARWAVTTGTSTTTIRRPATLTDQARHDAWQQARDAAQEKEGAEREAALRDLGPEPPIAPLGETLEDTFVTPGKSIFWSDGVTYPDDAAICVVNREEKQNTTTVWTVRDSTNEPVTGKGRFNLDFLLYHLAGMEFETKSNALLETMRLAPRLATPLLVMFIVSWITPRLPRELLDRYFVKMKTPVLPDPEADARELEASYANPASFENRKLFPGTDWEFRKPTFLDIAGFVVCLGICVAIISFAAWLANLGA